MRFRFRRSEPNEPVLSIAPLSTRMVTSYVDRSGRYHLFADIIDHDREVRFQDVLASWDSEIKYFSSSNMKEFSDHGVVVAKGKWTGDAATADLDCVGAASPGVTMAGDRVLLFYAGRGPVDPAGPFAPTKDREDLPGRVMLAIAPVDENGAPAGPFEKSGPVTDFEQPWRNIRHDDPCGVVSDGRIYVFYKGIGQGRPYDNRVFGLSWTSLDQPAGPYTHHPDPILQVSNGAEVPRVFKIGNDWHMFCLQYQKMEGAYRRWHHYTAREPTDWHLADDELLTSHIKRPGEGGAADMCPIWRPFQEEPPRRALAAGLDDGRFGHAGLLKQWLLEIQEV